MKLFEKYLLACTNQRIPMPEEWQATLGLALGPQEQQAYKINAPITGYKFQQDDVLQRGYVHRQVSSMQLDSEATYLLQLYLLALRQHKRIDAVPYLSVSTGVYAYPYYTTTVDVVKEFPYTIYGRTELDVKIEFINTARDVLISEQHLAYLDANSPIVVTPKQLISNYLATAEPIKIPVINNKFTIDGLLYEYSEGVVKIPRNGEPGTYFSETITPNDNEFILNSIQYTLEFETVDNSTLLVAVSYQLTPEILSASDEFYQLVVTSSAPVTVVPGAYPDTPFYRVQENQEPVSSFTAQVAMSDGRGFYPLRLSRAGYFGLPFSNKLISTLLDMNITEQSPVKERELIPTSLRGENYKQRIMLNTLGIFDVDENLGDKLVW